MVDVIAVVVERAINYFCRLPAGATSALDNAFNLASVDSIILFNHTLRRNFANIVFRHYSRFWTRLLVQTRVKFSTTTGTTSDNMKLENRRLRLMQLLTQRQRHYTMAILGTCHYIFLYISGFYLMTTINSILEENRVLLSLEMHLQIQQVEYWNLQYIL